MMYFMSRCCIHVSQLEPFSHLPLSSLTLRKSLRFTSWITEVAVSALRGISMSSLYVGTWGPEENLQNCHESLGRYRKSQEQRQSARGKVSWGTKCQENSLAGHSQNAWVNQLCPACVC